ncbi:MAG TPA: 3D-(3,5/4)-trihydroxycyclohexane-1,2-dione acylhydrolase (decyclizing) [Bryobacteraceae bacterium]|nr:3D-(3,5/4)-trihydroxycyclohexane-1,2-dione acylhydrolase (decyclizing) [Bryobacteraceae bacterium]
MKTRRLTTAQALVRFLKNQYVERDGTENAFFVGVWGIFGHGNVAGLGQALLQDPDLRYYLCRNEQAMVHTAIGYAKQKNRLATFACTTSIGPGATNMVTGAATATVNRLPVLLLPGDIFARRNVAPVLQQIESEFTQDISANDAFKPVSRYWDRINRPDQLPFAVLEAMRVLTSPAQTGAVTLAMPQDVQAEACDYPAELFEKRVWHIARPEPDRVWLKQAAEWIRAAEKPLIIAGGGAIYAGAEQALDAFATQTGIAVSETQSGKGALPFDHPQQLGAIGVNGTRSANVRAADADLIIAIGTRLTDFTTASKTQFQNPDVRFININVAELDAFKQSALPLVCDAKVALESLAELLKGHRVGAAYTDSVAKLKKDWEAEVDRLVNMEDPSGISQSNVIGAVNRFSGPKDVVVCAAGSLPGDLLRLWRTRDSKGYHLEYGNSCMGYEIAGGLGAKMADPSREVYVMVGDGAYQMMSSEIATSLQEGYKLNIILIDNHGFASINGLSKAVGCQGFGTEYRFRNNGGLTGKPIPIDFVANAASYGAHAIRAKTPQELECALEQARHQNRTTVIVVETDMNVRVPGYNSWWDVPVAEVSELEAVRALRSDYEAEVKKERTFLADGQQQKVAT